MRAETTRFRRLSELMRIAREAKSAPKSAPRCRVLPRGAANEVPPLSTARAKARHLHDQYACTQALAWRN
jgi:hypothetical protein